MDTVTAYFSALGLSTAAGLNAYIPLLAVGLFERYKDLITLPAPFDHLGDPLVLAIVVVVGALDFVGDKIPVVDHVLHAAGAAIAPIVAAFLAIGVLVVAVLLWRHFRVFGLRIQGRGPRDD